MSNRTLHRFLLILLLAGLVQPALAAETRDKWVEEVLLQLSELRKSQGELTKQVAELRAEVAALKSQGGGNRAASIDLRNSAYPMMGAANAQVAIVEFSDFECPFCRRHKEATFASLKSRYVDSGKVKYYFLDFPLAFHKNAEDSAVAAACAHQQGKFWQLHDALFENQSKLGKDLFKAKAAEIGLDAGKFQTCMADPKVREGVQARFAMGEDLGVQGTPAFLVGRLKDGMLTDIQTISGAQPIAAFDRVLGKLLGGS